MTKYEVKAYAKENGNYEMIEWATGISATSVNIIIISCKTQMKSFQ